MIFFGVNGADFHVALLDGRISIFFFWLCLPTCPLDFVKTLSTLGLAALIYVARDTLILCSSQLQMHASIYLFTE
jgi:hypothetical protein